MGTRALIKFGGIKADEIAIIYVHQDGYPTSLGSNLVAHLSNVQYDSLNDLAIIAVRKVASFATGTVMLLHPDEDDMGQEWNYTLMSVGSTEADPMRPSVLHMRVEMIDYQNGRPIKEVYNGPLKDFSPTPAMNLHER